MQRFVLAGAYALALSAAVAELGAATGSPFDQVVSLVKQGAAVPATSFVDQTGRPIAFADLRGNTVAVAFVYFRCRDSCPIVTRRLADTAASVGSGPYRYVEVTIDPEHDDVAAARAFAAEYRLETPSWHILTGDVRSVDEFDRRMGVNAVASGPDTILHNDRIAVVGPDGSVALYIDGSSWTAADLAAEMRHVSGASGSIVDRFDLWIGNAAAFCGGLVAGRAGIGDLVASLAVLGAGIALFIWLARRITIAGG